MGELLDATPERELLIGCWTGGDEFDGGFLRLWSVDAREENRGVVRSAQVLLQAKPVVDDLTFALSPDIAHVTPLTARSCEPVDEDTPAEWRATAERALRRLRQGWNLIRRRQGPGARHPHFGMKQAGKGAAFLSVSERLVGALGKTLRMRGYCGCGPDQRIASADAGTAKITRNFLMDIHGMEKRRCAVQNGD